MVAISPFCALRYNPELISDLSQVIAPPYDVIDAEEQERLHRASSYNLVRLILGKQDPSDTQDENRYTRAQRDFNAWREQGILRRDPVPALYLVEQLFTDEAGVVRSRVGFIALLHLHDAMERLAYRHEATLAAPKEDRAKLLQALPANLEPIFCVYPDEGGTVATLIRTLTKRAQPAAHATMKDAEVRVWPITETEVIQTVARHLTSTVVLIADGHHRFEVAYANRHRYRALMSYFVSMAETSLIVRPIHRILQACRNPHALHELCLIEPAADLTALIQWLQDPTGEGHFGYYDAQKFYRVQLKSDAFAQWLMAPAVALPLATLDVSLLHGLILPRLGINVAGVRYTAEAASALQAVKRGEGASAWLLRGIPLRQVYALAAAGLTLPPKSTYFYPKVPSGLTINPLT